MKFGVWLYRTAILASFIFLGHQLYILQHSSHSNSDEQSSNPPDMRLMTNASDHKIEPVIVKGSPKAAIVVLCRNSEVDAIVATLRNFQAKFNAAHMYPYVFMNNEEFSLSFKEQVDAVAVAPVKYVHVDQSMWSYPPHIDQNRAAECMREMESKGINYGGLLSYRHMCRFFSGFFFRHESLLEYDWYWRLEPGVSFYCDIDEDPFVFMEKHDKSYGFNVAIFEDANVIETLYKTTKEWAVKREVTSPLMPYFLDDQGGYNGCHFWSNFEIGRLDLWRGERYIDFFQHLDASGGFFYERWGDAPVHSIYVGLTLRKDQVHYFKNIGYLHAPYYHCNNQKELKSKCDCPRDGMFKSVDEEICLRRWLSYQEKDWSYKDVKS